MERNRPFGGKINHEGENEGEQLDIKSQIEIENVGMNENFQLLVDFKNMVFENREVTPIILIGDEKGRKYQDDQYNHHRNIQ